MVKCDKIASLFVKNVPQQSKMYPQCCWRVLETLHVVVMSLRRKGGVGRVKVYYERDKTIYSAQIIRFSFITFMSIDIKMVLVDISPI